MSSSLKYSLALLFAALALEHMLLFQHWRADLRHAESDKDQAEQAALQKKAAFLEYEELDIARASCEARIEGLVEDTDKCLTELANCQEGTCIPTHAYESLEDDLAHWKDLYTAAVRARDACEGRPLDSAFTSTP